MLVKKYYIFLVFYFFQFAMRATVQAQSTSPTLLELQNMVRKEGELFIAVERVNTDKNKLCLEENSIANVVQFTNDSAFVNYINHTELFCEVYVMRTHYTYQLDLKDIDPARIRLVEKKYAIGEAQLKEGKITWFEVQLFTREDKLLIQKQDIESRQAEQLSSFSLIVGDKESAKKAIALLKRGINELLQ